MGLSRNKVAVPEGAAGTPPFWRMSNLEVKKKVGRLLNASCLQTLFFKIQEIRDEGEAEHIKSLGLEQHHRQSYSSVG